MVFRIVVVRINSALSWDFCDGSFKRTVIHDVNVCMSQIVIAILLAHCLVPLVTLLLDSALVGVTLEVLHVVRVKLDFMIILIVKASIGSKLSI